MGAALNYPWNPTRGSYASWMKRVCPYHLVRHPPMVAMTRHRRVRRVISVLCVGFRGPHVLAAVARDASLRVPPRRRIGALLRLRACPTRERHQSEAKLSLTYSDCSYGVPASGADSPTRRLTDKTPHCKPQIGLACHGKDLRSNFDIAL